jgi:hypothetical protein
MEMLLMTKRIRLPLTGRFWLASYDVFGVVSIYACRTMHDEYGTQKLYHGKSHSNISIFTNTLSQACQSIERKCQNKVIFIRTAFPRVNGGVVSEHSRQIQH